jgi:tRNA (cmo5U34)-methyltransferase
VNVRQLTPSYDAIFNMALALLEQKLSDTATLLIAGAGSGTKLNLFGRPSSQWQMMGVDPSAQMLHIASKKVEAMGLGEGVTLIKEFVNDDRLESS